MTADVTIVGAGPAGLAVARELARLGIRAPLLEAGRTGETWANQYDGMRLHGRASTSSLPGLALRGTRTPFPSADEMHAYLVAYARHFALDVHEGVRVEEACRSGGSWRLRTTAGEHATHELVMATGIWSAPVAPTLPGASRFRGRVLHASAYRSREELRGRHVLVVGLGNTGKDLALAAVQVGASTTIAVRGGVVFVPYPNAVTQHAGALWRRLPPHATDAVLRRIRREPDAPGLRWPPGHLGDASPVVGEEMLHAARRGAVTIRPAPVALTRSGARFADGSEAAFDVVVFATGYRPALDAVAAHLGTDGPARPGRSGFAARGAPGLHLVGYEYPTLETWLQQLRREAPAAARAIARAVREGR